LSMRAFLEKMNLWSKADGPLQCGGVIWSSDQFRAWKEHKGRGRLNSVPASVLELGHWSLLPLVLLLLSLQTWSGIHTTVSLALWA
jgi:hypothetical protein